MKHITDIVGVGLGRPMLESDVLFQGRASPAPTTFAIKTNKNILIVFTQKPI